MNVIEEQLLGEDRIVVTRNVQELCMESNK